MIHHHHISQLVSLINDTDKIEPGAFVTLYYGDPVVNGRKVDGQGLVLSVLPSEGPTNIMVATVMWHELPRVIFVSALPRIY